MNLSLTCFGASAGKLDACLDQAAELGFRGIAGLDSGDLAEQPLNELPSHLHGRTIAASWDSFLPASSPDDPASAPSAMDPQSWQRAAAQWPLVFAGLRAVGASTLILDLGCQAATGAEERGEKLLSALEEAGSIDPGMEALEPLRNADSGQTERQLEAVARFVHSIRQHAPGLQVALRAQASPAALLRPSHLSLLRNDAGLDRLGYWHDCGAAQTRAAFGLEQPGDWLDAAGATLAGTSLQDWAEGRDLLLPGEGVVDFQLLAEYLPRDATRVLTAAPVYPMGSLPAARDTLAAFGIR